MSAIPITVTGTIATEPTARTLPSGRACASFRLAVNHWRLDKASGEFVDDGTSWFGVDCYGELASNTAMSLNTGAAVIVSGSLRNREWSTAERSGISPTVVAEHIGPDLKYGTAHYRRAKSADRSSGGPARADSETSNTTDGPWDQLDHLDTPTSESTSGDGESTTTRFGLSTSEPGDEMRSDDGLDAQLDGAIPESAAPDGNEPGGEEEDAIARETANAAAPF